MTRSENGSSQSDPDIAGLDALDGERGPARPLSVAETARIADRVMLRQRESTSRLRQASSGRVVPVRGGPRRWPRWLLGAAGVTLATAAAALYATDWLVPSRGAASSDGPSFPARQPGARDEAAQSTAPDSGQRDASPTAPEASDPDGRPTDTATDLLDAEQRRAPRTIAHESRRAADHLARANALRGKRRYREALDLYLYVVSEYPGSMQSRAAQLAAAAIRLEQLRDIDGAEELYQAVRKNSDGELAAQAAFGLAEVARARADRGAESRALREFLARYAGHPLSAAARRRLDALESP